MDGTILVATAGQGILRSNDDGTTWHRLGLKEAIEFDGVVRSVLVDPHDPVRVFAGADVGLCVSADGGAHFTRIDTPMNDMTIWSLAIDPSNPDVMFAGTGAPSRCCVYRTQDGGASWEAVVPVFPEYCQGVNRPRLLAIAIDSADPDEVWFGVEEGGAYRSRDGGDTWTRVDAPEGGITSPDIHDVVVLRQADGSRRHAVLTVNSVCRSSDDGESWDSRLSAERFDDMYYTRTLVPLADNALEQVLAIGDGTPGTRAMIYRTDDGGETWAPTEFDRPPNSTFWAIATHPSNADLLFAGTKYGHLYRSIDRGRTWAREWREFSEITSVAWTPHFAPLQAAHRSTGMDEKAEQ